MPPDLALLARLPDIIPQRPDLDGHVFVYSSNREFLGSVYAGEHQEPLVYLLDNAATLLTELDRLTAELAAAPEAARRWSAIRAAVATVQAATGLGGDTPLDDDAVAELLSGALQNAARVHFAETALRVDAEANARTLEHHRRLFVGQQARAERAEAELAAAQAELTAARRGPVVEWRKFLEYERASCGAFRLVVHGGGWYLTAQGLERAATVDSGEETGPAGKSAAEAAYRKAAGL